ncbi:MAG: hypothetical protein KDK90_24010 [Leptospiraceae bacterium]|nr:hypothetical protein [Leptospiraceae bacterium]
MIVIQLDTIFDGNSFQVKDKLKSEKIEPNKHYKIIVLPETEELESEFNWILKNKWWILFEEDFRTAIDEMLENRKSVPLQERNLFE